MDACDELRQRLSRLDSCAVSDALDKLGLPGCVTGLAALTSQKKIAGWVRTMKLVAKDAAPVQAGPPKHLGTTAIEAANRGEIIVIEQRSGIDAASWGGILSLGASLRGVAGVIADGPVRDIDEARQLDFPIFGRFATARTARNRIAEVANDEPVTIGNVLVRAGDLALADGTAVVFIAADQAARVIQTAEAIAHREAAMADALRSGRRITEIMGADYEHMLDTPDKPAR
jgi:4-hydroxy-4-methyl-2-oxoglutarate aldolase